MKTTIELPDALFEQAKLAAIHRRKTFKELVVRGLELVLSERALVSGNEEALKRLRNGYALGGSPIKREDTHAR